MASKKHQNPEDPWGPPVVPEKKDYGDGTGLTLNITYAQGWDGGNQERDAAIEAIKRVFPKAKCTSQHGGGWPMTVTIRRDGPDGEVVIKVPQRELFRKYWSMREKSQTAIEEALKAML